MTNPTREVPVAAVQTVAEALRAAFNFGMTYCHQADHDFASVNRKAEQTKANYDLLVEATISMLATPPADHSEQPAICMGCVEQSSRIRDLEHKMDYYAGIAEQPSAAQVPDGYALVPVDPTPAMLRAGVHVAVGVLPIYQAMLAAAPKAPEGREWPDDEIVAAWNWCEKNGGTPAEFLSHSLLAKRSRVLGRPLTWREAIELTAITTNMPDERRDKLLAIDDEIALSAAQAGEVKP